jgi:hypothetical protein
MINVQACFIRKFQPLNHNAFYVFICFHSIFNMIGLCVVIIIALIIIIITIIIIIIIIYKFTIAQLV